ncbi:MAG: hypothetical protein RL095_2242 [Verrucomicrobiota bacterium]|jgi:sugar phosphate isomerase/epimerase
MIKSALSLFALCSFALGASAVEIRDEDRQGGFAVGAQAWSFNRFSCYEAIEKNAKCGGKVIEIFPGQQISREDKGKIGPGMSDDQIAALKAHLSKHKVRAVNLGVIGIPNNETEARKIFEFAKKMELYCITTESDESIDVIEKLVKEFDICVAYHGHPRREKQPGYKVWDPNYIAALVKDRDPRIGACADLGHWATSGIKPIDGLKILEGRVLSSHVKDRSAIGHETPCIPFGTGVSDIAGCLAELKRQGFKGNLSVEFEALWNDNAAEIGQCIGFVRATGLALEKKP